jgi:hypothetical protein
MLQGFAGMMLLTMVVTAAPEKPSAPAESPELIRAREKGLDFLLTQFKDRQLEECPSQPGGVPSLAVLAILKSGVKPGDERLAKPLAKVRALKPTTTYVVSLQTLALCAADLKSDMDTIRRNAKWLEEAQLKDKPARVGAWSYTTGREPAGPGGNGNGNNSNSQFALLALYEADLAGAPVGTKTWRLAMDHWINSQNKDGSWGYYNPLPSTGSMTCAGMLSISLAVHRINGKSDRDAATLAIRKGTDWLTKHFTIDYNPPKDHKLWHLYYLRDLELAARFTQQSRFGEHDWRLEGTHLLLKMQNEDGSWKGTGHAEENSSIATSVALLFLSPEANPSPLSKEKK